MALKSTPVWEAMQRQAQFSGGRLLCRRGAGNVIELVDKATGQIEKTVGDPDWRSDLSDSDKSLEDKPR